MNLVVCIHGKKSAYKWWPAVQTPVSMVNCSLRVYIYIGNPPYPHELMLLYVQLIWLLLYKGLEHLQILIPNGSWNQSQWTLRDNIYAAP